VCYYGAGVVGIIIAIITGLTIKEPERKAIGEETAAGENAGKSKKQDWMVLCQPRVILLCVAAAIRHTGKLSHVFPRFPVCLRQLF